MSIERFIIQNIEREKLKESLYNLGGITDNSTADERSLKDLIDVYSLMIERGFAELPEATSEKKALRELEDKIDFLGMKITKSPVVNNEEFPGEYL